MTGIQAREPLGVIEVTTGIGDAINFAKQVTDYLDEVRKANKLSKVLIVAAPAFLGELRK
jgi:protein required for attachment to host cells